MRRLLSSQIALAMALLFAAPAPAQTAAGPRMATFGWASPGFPAVLAFPLPDSLTFEEIEALAGPEGAELLGFGLDGAHELSVQLALTDGHASFSGLDLTLADGTTRTIEVGPTELVGLGGDQGPLRFVRSLAAPSRGLPLAVLLHNGGDRTVEVSRVRYLPAGLEAGRLLAASGSLGAADLEELAQALSEQHSAPATPSSDAAEGVETRLLDALPPGFAFVEPGAPGLQVAAGADLLLAWTDAAFAGVAGTGVTSRPVIEYGPAGAAPSWGLGLPATARVWP